MDHDTIPRCQRVGLLVPSADAALDHSAAERDDTGAFGAGPCARQAGDGLAQGQLWPPVKLTNAHGAPQLEACLGLALPDPVMRAERDIQARETPQRDGIDTPHLTAADRRALDDLHPMLEPGGGQALIEHRL